MVQLTRTVRFSSGPDLPQPDGVNGFAGKPAMDLLARYDEIDITCRGTPEERTGYLIDIQRLDEACRSTLTPLLRRASGPLPPTMRAMWDAIASTPLDHPVTRLRWRPTPWLTLEHQEPAAMPDPATPARILLRQTFDLSAAHRLSVPGFSNEENRRLYGKCSNPNGHGHNYRIEPAFSMPADPDAAPVPTSTLESIVERVILDRFDHTHLNEDTDEFSASSGVIPSVENIARVFYELLAPEVERGAQGVRLASIRVWETDRTCAEFPG